MEEKKHWRVKIGPGPGEEAVYAWLVEDIGSPDAEPRYLGFEETSEMAGGRKDYRHIWTRDPWKATWFARKIDARAVAAYVHMDVHRIYEHAFSPNDGDKPE